MRVSVIVTDKAKVAIPSSRPLVCIRDSELLAVHLDQRSHRPWLRIALSRLLHGCSFPGHVLFGFAYRLRNGGLLALLVLP